MADEEPDLLPAELALGVLSPAEREQALRLAASDSRFAAEVDAWEERLLVLTTDLRPQQPPSSLLDKIETELDRKHHPVRRPDNVVDLSTQISTLRNRLRVWKAAAVASGVAATVFGLIVLAIFGSSGWFAHKQNQYVAFLRDNGGQDGFVVTLNTSKKQMVIRSLEMWPPPAKSYELWVIREDGSNPATLGLVATSPYVMLDIRDLIKKAEQLHGLKLAVSLEPEGGAPEGKVMGPVMFAGKLVRQMP